VCTGHASLQDCHLSMLVRKGWYENVTGVRRHRRACTGHAGLQDCHLSMLVRKGWYENVIVVRRLRRMCTRACRLARPPSEYVGNK